MTFDPNKNYYLCIGKFRIGISKTPVPGKTGDDAFPVYATNPYPSDIDASVKINDHGNGRYDALFIDSNRQYCLPMIQDISTPALGQSRAAGLTDGWQEFFIRANPNNPNVGILFRMEGDQTSGVIVTVAEA